jgi:hypothetical protein
MTYKGALRSVPLLREPLVAILSLALAQTLAVAGGDGDVAAPDGRKPARATVVAQTTRGPWRSHGCAV